MLRWSRTPARPADDAEFADRHRAIVRALPPTSREARRASPAPCARARRERPWGQGVPREARTGPRPGCRTRAAGELPWVRLRGGGRPPGCPRLEPGRSVPEGFPSPNPEPGRGHRSSVRRDRPAAGTRHGAGFLRTGSRAGVHPASPPPWRVGCESSPSGSRRRRAFACPRDTASLSVIRAVERLQVPDSTCRRKASGATPRPSHLPSHHVTTAVSSGAESTCPPG